ncbi:MAG: phycobiliprotein lyase [Kovacikia sp.]
MDIVDFFQLSSGKWFSHRTSHLLTDKRSEGGKSEVLVEMLPKTAPEVIQLCEQYGIDPDWALCGSRISWNGTIEEKKKQSGSTVLVPIADSEQANMGKLLRKIDSAEKPVAGRYAVGSDEALTLIIEDGPFYSEERIWFASPNLRLRTTILKQADGFSTASFSSEIRMGLTKPPENKS